MHAPNLQDLFTWAMADAQQRYDPHRHLVSSGAMGEAGGTVFRPAASLPFARALLQSGRPEQVEQAADIITAVLQSQELDPRHPHCGNFTWLAGDEGVTDLNAIQFVLRGLLPILAGCAHLLPGALVERCKTAVALALAEEERLNVSPTYTNIHLMSLFALLVGAQLLDDPAFRGLGLARWKAFVDFTVRSGAPHEYNSSNYGAVDLSTLAAIITHCSDPAVQLQAHLLYERLWLHLGLHFHLPTGQLAGPHCRAYWWPMTTGQSMLSDLVWRVSGWRQLSPGESGEAPPMESLYALELLLQEHSAPPYLFSWLAAQAGTASYAVSEIANAYTGDDIYTYLSPNFALGTASQTYSIGTNCFYIEHQANYLLLHYTRPGKHPDWGMVYTRFVVNDQHWGTKGAAADRPKDANFYDQGHFAGTQYENKAIGLYTLEPQNEDVSSLKTLVIFRAEGGVEGAWLNGKRVAPATLPLALQVGDWLVVEDGSVYVALCPLEPTSLGTGEGIRLEKGPQDELWLSISNYQGVAKRFWEYASLGGAFWRGNLKAGFILEVANRRDFDTAVAFYRSLARAEIHDSVDAENVRSVTYARDGDVLRLDYDLWRTRPAGRWTNGQKVEPPMLQSPLAVQGDSGLLELGAARLRTANQPVWLIGQEALPGERTWIAVNPQDSPTHLRLETPSGLISAEEWGLGRVEWRAPVGGEEEVVFYGLQKPGRLKVPENVQVSFRIASADDLERG